MTEPRLVIKASDAQAAGFCGPGIYAVVKALGGDMRRFMWDGYPISDLEGVENAHVQRLVTLVKGRGHVDR